MGKPQVRRRVGGQRGDPLPACSTQWDSLAHVGAEYDADGDGVEEAMYYNGYRAGIDLVGPQPDASGDGGNHRCFAHHLGLEHMAFHGVQGRGSLVDLAHRLGTTTAVSTTALKEIMAANNVVVEPGDMLLLHTGFATEILKWNRDPDPAKIFTLCSYLDARDESLLQWITDSQISALVADNYRSKAYSATTATRVAIPSFRSTTSACSGSVFPWARCGTCTSSRRGCVNTDGAGSS